jgi:hypothetical protein
MFWLWEILENRFSKKKTCFVRKKIGQIFILISFSAFFPALIRDEKKSSQSF